MTRTNLLARHRRSPRASNNGRLDDCDDDDDDDDDDDGGGGGVSYQHVQSVLMYECCK